jgi:Restriction endonuclease
MPFTGSMTPRKSNDKTSLGIGAQRGSRKTKADSDFRDIYQRLKSPPAEPSSDWFRKRGRDFERVMSGLLHEEGLEPRLRYRPKGEEIDGSFVSHGRVFLVEAKWHGSPMPASALYIFKGKVDGKLVDTLGVFISMSGYSRDAVEALMIGKDLNVVLFDAVDIDASIDKNVGFQRVLGYKLRLASERAVVYAPYEGLFVSTARVEAKIMREDEKI